MIIGIDFDDVLCETTEAVLQVYNKRHGTFFSKQDVRGWDIAEQIGADEDEVEALFSDPEVWDVALPTSYAPQYLKKLDEEHEIYIITATYLNAVEPKFKWFKERFPFIEEEQIIICHEKQLVDVDVFIDDGVHNMGDPEDIGRCQVLFLTPWNKEYKSQFKTVTSLGEFYDFIKELEA